VDAVELRPLGVGETLDVSIKIWRRHFGVLARAVVLLVAPVQVFSALVQISLPTASTTNVGNPNQTPTLPADFWTRIAGTFVVTILTYVVAVLAAGACFKAVSEAYVGVEPDWRSSLRFALSRLRSLVWLSLSTTVLLGLSLLGCIVPGVYFWGAWAVATPALLVEGLKGRRARQRSRELVRGRWLPVFGALALGTLLNQIVAAAITVPAIALTLHGRSHDLGGAAVRAVAGVASSAITTPFLATLIAVLYYDLRVRKEGFDLELLAQHVGVAPPEGVQFIAPPPPVPSGEEPPFWPPPPGWRPASERD